MLARQRGACKICRRVRPSETLCIDHRHATGSVRALLCRKCNLGLGAYDDNPYWLVRAAAYLVLSLIQEMASRLLVRVASLCRRAAAAATKLMSRIGRICVTLAANTGSIHFGRITHGEVCKNCCGGDLPGRRGVGRQCRSASEDRRGPVGDRPGLVPRRSREEDARNVRRRHQRQGRRQRPAAEARRLRRRRRRQCQRAPSPRG